MTINLYHVVSVLIVLLKFTTSCSVSDGDHEGRMSLVGSSLYDCGRPVAMLPFCCLPEW